jgi:acyl-CoA thioesterase FadM
LTYRVFKKKNNERILAAKGSSVLVSYNYIDQKSIPLEESWKNELKRFMN